MYCFRYKMSLGWFASTSSKEWYLNTVSEGPVGFVDNAALAFGPMGCFHI